MSANGQLPLMVQSFFQRFLITDRDVSPHTVRSYRDALKLFLCFAAGRLGRPPEALTFEDLDAELVRAFLGDAELHRGNKPRSRNQRLAALKTFFRYVATNSPEHLDRCRRIRELPSKAIQRPEPEFLERGEVDALFDAIDPNSPAGRRDQTLLLLLYNTGARVQEVVSLNVGDLRLDAAPLVRLKGKGRKVRSCPLWSRTAQTLQRWIASLDSPPPSSPLFLNRRGQRLSRSGVAYILRTAADRAGLARPARARHLTPHVMRHTTAMHLLEAKVDITTIAAWLGHAQLSTTHGYVKVDLRMKQDALEVASTPKLREGSYPSPGLIEWLAGLAKAPRYAQPEGRDAQRSGADELDST